MSESPFHFGPTPARPDAVRVEIPAHAAPDAVYACYRSGLGLPDWFGANLDALFDALCDQRAPVLVVHGGLPEAPGDWVARYLDTLADALEQLDEADLQVSFPALSRAAVQAASRR